MGKGIESLEQKEGLLGPDPLSEALRGKIREVIWALAEAELSEVLAALPYERKGERRGYRSGKRERTIGTGLGQAVKTIYYEELTVSKELVNTRDRPQR